MANIVKKTRDLRYLNFSIDSKTSGTAGTFLKAEEVINNKKIYYKLSNYDSQLGIIGHESVNELIVDRLLNLLNFKHLSYDLINANITIDGRIINTYLCMSEDFKKDGDSKIAIDIFYRNQKNENEDILSFCKRFDFIDNVYEFLLLDYLILNRDRHGANVEVIYNKYEDSFNLSPIFDNGLSLLFSCHDDKEIEDFDILEDKRVQCFFASNSTLKNLELIPKNKLNKPIDLNDNTKDYLFNDLDDVISKKHIDKIWKMIKERYKLYESIRNKK